MNLISRFMGGIMTVASVLFFFLFDYRPRRRGKIFKSYSSGRIRRGHSDVYFRARKKSENGIWTSACQFKHRPYRIFRIMDYGR